MQRRLAITLAAALQTMQKMQISSNGMRQSTPGPKDYFTGTVTVTPLFPPNADSNVGGGQVEFTPGARSAWHTHPAGQTLVITSGTGWVQEDGGPKLTVKAGDVIWTPPSVRHWHGATASTSMTHIAITPNVNGKNVDWAEQVPDEQYRR